MYEIWVYERLFLVLVIVNGKRQKKVQHKIYNMNKNCFQALKEIMRTR